MKSALRISFFVLAAFFAMASLLIFGSAGQVEKNKMLLADMKDVVHAINDFKEKTDRLPNDEELAKLEDTVPRRRSLRYGFHFGAPPKFPGENYPEKEEAGGWMIWYWRGEWAEFYSSWDDHYSLAEQISFWKFCGPTLIWTLLASLLFFGLGFLKILRSNPTVKN